MPQNLDFMGEEKTRFKEVRIYTDGACSGNPGPGGYGVVLLYGEHRRELSGGFRLTTNNRMEILAAIVALEALKEKCNATLCTDSALLFNSMSKGWARGWRTKGWRTKAGTRTNADLWKPLLELCARHEVKFLWIKGHAGLSETERADELAREAVKQGNLAVDKAYEGA